MNSSRSLRQALKGKILTFNKNPVRVLNNFKCQNLLSSSLSLFDNSEFMECVLLLKESRECTDRPFNYTI